MKPASQLQVKLLTPIHQDDLAPFLEDAVTSILVQLLGSLMQTRKQIMGVIAGIS